MVEDRDYMRQPEFGGGWRFKFSLTFGLILLHLLVFVVLELFRGYAPATFLKIYQYGALSNDGLAHWRVWQFITFQFLHVGHSHFLGNMLGIYFFGRAVEDFFGGKKMLLMYLACGIFGGVLQTALGLIVPTVFSSPVVGASAGVFGLLAMFAAHKPDGEILIFFVFPAKAKHIAWLGAAVALFYTIVPADPGMAHAAHLGGMIMGWALVRVDWRRFAPRKSEETTISGRVARLEVLEPTDRATEAEVDAILDKISAKGIESLTKREREILEAARKKMTRS